MEGANSNQFFHLLQFSMMIHIDSYTTANGISIHLVTILRILSAFYKIVMVIGFALLRLQLLEVNIILKVKWKVFYFGNHHGNFTDNEVTFLFVNTITIFVHYDIWKIWQHEAFWLPTSSAFILQYQQDS